MIRGGAFTGMAFRQAVFAPVPVLLVPMFLMLAAVFWPGFSAKAADGYFRAPISIVSPPDLNAIAETVVGHYAERNPRTGFSVRGAGTRQAAQWLCAAGGKSVDVAILPRRLWHSERRHCSGNGVAVAEYAIGAQALVALAGKGTPSFDIDLASLYRAVSGEAVRWSAIDPRLPDLPVRVLLPAGPSGRSLLDEAGLQDGCRRVPAVQAIADADERVAACIRRRGDGVVTQYDGATELLAALAGAGAGTIALLPRDAMARAVEDYPVLSVDGVQPTVRAIRSGAYPLARHLYLYARQGGLPAVDAPPDLHGFLLTATSASFTQEGGHFERMGLILPLAADTVRPQPTQPAARDWAADVATRAESVARTAWASVASLAEGIAGLFRADSLGVMAESVLRENQDLTRLLELAGFDLMRVERDGMFLPRLDATFSRRRDLTGVERGLLEHELERLAQAGLDFGQTLKLAVIEDLLDIADGGRFQVNEVVVTFHPRVNARYVLTPQFQR